MNPGRSLTSVALLAAATTGGGEQQDPPVGGGHADATLLVSKAADPDVRTASASATHVLTEMRGMLTSVQRYVGAAGRGDSAGLATHVMLTRPASANART